MDEFSASPQYNEVPHIYWREVSGIIHACESGPIPDGILVWTLCHLDIPPKRAYTASTTVITCAQCRAEIERRKSQLSAPASQQANATPPAA
jgi:hypothetical protein